MIGRDQEQDGETTSATSLFKLFLKKFRAPVLENQLDNKLKRSDFRLRL
jgi:hypothetical protein